MKNKLNNMIGLINFSIIFKFGKILENKNKFNFLNNKKK